MGSMRSSQGEAVVSAAGTAVVSAAGTAVAHGSAVAAAEAAVGLLPRSSLTSHLRGSSLISFFK